jgi:predicted kinase
MKTNQPTTTKKEAIFLMGPPAAGKSSTRQKLFPGLPVIDPDEIKKTLPGYDPKNPSRVHLQSKVLARKQFEEMILGNSSFVYDTTGGNVERMLREMAEARENGFTITILQVTCSLEECLRRNRQRERTVPDEVVRSIWYEVREAAGKLLPHADRVIKVDTSP